MDILLKHPWIVFLIFTIVNGIDFKMRSKNYIESNPELRDGYNKLIKGWFIIFTFPLLLIATGDLTGLTNGIWDYLEIKSLNPIILFIHVYFLLIGIFGSIWIYFKDGAKFIARHPGLIRFRFLFYSKDITSPFYIQLSWSLFLLSGLIFILMFWNKNIPF